ncbi:MAG: InlB B-repeat-containing protein, partial [Oscillospiraceae bacterium]|nr:InlB B-repeat-containing protein [Oscillospiraceae bacterium]
LFTVSFDPKGGTACDPITLHDGDKLPKLPRPTRSGYSFRCWRDQNGKYIAEGALLTAEDITLYADWIKTFKVTFDSNGGSSCSSITVRDGDALPALPTPTRSGYKFLCWLDKNYVPISEGANLTCEDITLYAHWIKLFTVSFDSNGGSSCSSITLQDGDTLPALPYPSRTGYKFVCWKDKNGTPIYEDALLEAEDITLYADWKKLFAVTFDSNGGSSCSPMVLEEGETLPALPKPSKSGYEFICWKDKNEMPIYEGAKLAAEDITLYAYYAKLCTINFDSRGGTSCSPINIREGDTIPALPTPTKENDEFICWRMENGMIVEKGAKITFDTLTLYALWKSDNLGG